MKIPPPLLALSLIILAFVSCQQSTDKVSQIEYFSIRGETMGTYYNVKYSDPQQRNLKPQVDSILKVINQSLSTYIPESYISKINSSVTQVLKYPIDPHFNKNFREAQKIYFQTEGLYDPTVGAMTNYYGFGKDRRVLRDSVSDATLDSLKALVGLDKFNMEVIDSICQISKGHPQMQVDFSSIAKGYAVDEISSFLLQEGCVNHLIDIGGDGLAKGANPSNNEWTIGINTPTKNSLINDFALVISVTNKGLATSGNYRNFYETGTKKYAHTINPKSGLPEITTLLSVSVIADNCMIADAYATACMVMGLNEGQNLISDLPGIEACWIHDTNKDGKLEMTMSEGFEKWKRN